MGRSRYFFLLSGEYETLPSAELTAVLRILDPGCSISCTSSRRILIAETVEEAAKAAVERAAYTKLCCGLGASARSLEDEVLNSVTAEVLGELIPPTASTFAVRGVRIGGARVDRMRLEREIGARILRLRPGLRVNLSNPEAMILFISDPAETFIGRLVEVKPKRFFSDRVAGRRPFTLPSAMQPDFSRAMVNLAEVAVGGRILDPFAGTGGIMIEAGLMGYQIYGVELKEWIAEGGLRNLKKYLAGGGEMIVGDARALMFRDNSFDAVVTDPPYGRSTTIPDRSITALLERFLEECARILKKGGRIVMAAPAEVDLEELAERHGMRILQTHLARVHGSLARRVVVLEP